MDDYKRLGKPEWGRKARKAISRSKKGNLKRDAKKEPREPEVHPAEIDLIEFEANCQHSPIERNGRVFCVHCGRPR